MPLQSQVQFTRSTRPTEACPPMPVRIPSQGLEGLFNEGTKLSRQLKTWCTCTHKDYTICTRNSWNSN